MRRKGRPVMYTMLFLSTNSIAKFVMHKSGTRIPPELSWSQFSFSFQKRGKEIIGYSVQISLNCNQDSVRNFLLRPCQDLIYIRRGSD